VRIDGLIERLRLEGFLIISLKVIPKSSKNAIVGILDDGSLKIKITAAPERGKANAAVCKLIANEFGVAKKNVQIVRGETDAHKQIVIRV
jgi:uncharacterized protein (TIGR00251 family)